MSEIGPVAQPSTTGPISHHNILRGSVGSYVTDLVVLSACLLFVNIR